MDHQNVSRYQNPPEQDQYSRLSHLNSKQDYLDVFVIGFLSRSPIIYVLINITLLIWLAQTIISSKIQEVPRSAYLISPFFGALPFKDISVTIEENCERNWQKIMLKTFPTIYLQSYTHKQMYRWARDDNITFCVKRITPELSKFEQNGTCSRFYCSQYCFQNQSQCPITQISIKKANENISKNQYIFYKSQKGKQNFLYSKVSGKPIVSLLASFHTRCANDYRYLDEYNKLDDYYKSLQNCGPEGTINTFYDKIDQIDNQKFMFINNRGKGTDRSLFREIQLGTVHQIDFNSDMYSECSMVREIAKNTVEYLFNDPVQPLFTQSLLVIGFILMIAQIIWLIIYVCVNGYFAQKNIIVILICIIELIVISFIYSQNSKLFDTQQVIRSIARCIETEIPAASTWNFGIQSSSSFTMIQYMGTIFLTLYFLSYLMDRFMFSPSSEFDRNYQYKDQDQDQEREGGRYGYNILEDEVMERQNDLANSIIFRN